MHPSEENESDQVEMPRYRSHKQVWALEIDTVSGNRLTFRDAGYAAIAAPAEMFTRYTPVPGDFYVVYDDGYKSFSPRKAFVEGYTKIDKEADARRAMNDSIRVRDDAKWQVALEEEQAEREVLVELAEQLGEQADGE